MHVKPIFGEVDMSVDHALKLLVENRITGFPIVDAKKKVIGIISEYDLIVQLSEKINSDPGVFGETIKFSSKTICVKEETPVSDVENIFINDRVRRVPVVDELGKLIGIVTRRDLMRHYFILGKFAHN